MVYHPASMKVLARGGQADIYEIDTGRILRVLRWADANSMDLLIRERSVMTTLRERGVGVPEVYECVEADGRPALAMQRIPGPSMMELLSRNLLGMQGMAGKLAGLHIGFLRTEAPDGLNEIKERAAYHVGVAELLDEADKAFIRALLGELPAGSALLHGDFHPGNILTWEGRYYIIDWFGATKGDPVADVAHSYLLCADKPRVPGEGWAIHRFMKTFAGVFGGAYLRHMRSGMDIGMADFGKWLAVRAAERSVYGQPSERPGRAAFVKACRRAHENGAGSASWHKLL